jgi:hypothetical protein
MTDRDIITAVAGLDGWQRRLTGWQKYPHAPLTPTEQLPPYLTSRDAIVPVIEKQPKSVQVNTSILLEEIVYRGTDCHLCLLTSILMVLATPSQLCEALLRATGTWKD